MARTIDKLSLTLVRLLKARGLEGRLSEYKVLGQWEKAVGAVIARHARPESVRGRTLALIVDSPAWMQQLSLLKPEIIRKLNERLGKETVRGISLKIGEIAPYCGPAGASPARANLDPEERARIETYVREIHDPDAQAAIRRVIEKDFLNRKK